MHVKPTNSTNNRRASRSRRTRRRRSRSRNKSKKWNKYRNKQRKRSNNKMLMYQRYIQNLILLKLAKMLLLGLGNSRLLIDWVYSPRYRIKRDCIVGPYSRGLMLRLMSIFDCFVLLFLLLFSQFELIYALIYMLFVHIW